MKQLDMLEAIKPEMRGMLVPQLTNEQGSLSSKLPCCLGGVILCCGRGGGIGPAGGGGRGAGPTGNIEPPGPSPA